MTNALRKTGVVQPGGKIELQAPKLAVGLLRFYLDTNIFICALEGHPQYRPVLGALFGLSPLRGTRE